MKNWDYENEQWTKLPPHLKHLPLFTQSYDIFSQLVKLLWSFFLKQIAFKFYVRLKVIGDLKSLQESYPKLLLISNHGSHLDATAIAAAVPLRYWKHLFIAAAKDYFFSNPLFSFFSKHCLGAIPIDRKDRRGEAIELCVTLLTKLERIWLIFFPEGTRSKDGSIQAFKKGVSVFSERSNVPLLFLYLEGNTDLWPKGQIFTKPGVLRLYVGPVHPPGNIQLIYQKYFEWVKTLPLESEPKFHLEPGSGGGSA